MENKNTVTETLYTAKLVWFAAGPAWTCQKFGKHVITIHHGDTLESKDAAVATCAKLEPLG